MTVAVAMPLFQGGPWVEAALASVRAQTLRPAEVVVVDDGSTDDGPARARHAPGVRVVPSLGKLRARHTGLLETSAPFVAFLDQDDVWHPEHLRLLHDALARAPEAPAAGVLCHAFPDGSRPRLHVRPGQRSVDPWATWPLACPFPTPSAVLFRREPLVAAGGWQVDAAPDWEVYLRLGATQPLLELRARTCGYRQHPGARSSVLRRDGFRYLDVQQRGARAALAWREAAGLLGGEGPALRRRLEVLDRLGELAHARADGSPAGIASAARGLEAALAGAPGDVVRRALAALVYLLCPAGAPGEHERHRGALLADLAAAWPPEAPRTADAIALERPGRRFTWRRLLRALALGRAGEASTLWRARGAARRLAGSG